MVVSMFPENRALEAVEASEVADEFNEVGEVLEPGKSLRRISESFRFLNSIILGLITLYFDVLKKI